MGESRKTKISAKIAMSAMREMLENFSLIVNAMRVAKGSSISMLL